MPHVNATSVSARPVGPIPGVPDAQAQALNRRLRLDHQLRSYRMTRRPMAQTATSPVNAPGEPVPA
jgi:hypothetical protein